MAHEKKPTQTRKGSNPDEPMEPAFEARIRVRNISGQTLSDCTVGIDHEWSGDWYRCRYLIRSKNTEGREFKSVHEVDHLTGFTRMVSPTDIPSLVKVDVDRVTKALPWWITRVTQDPETATIHYSVLRPDLSVRTAYVATPVSQITVQPVDLHLRALEKLSARITHTLALLKPTPSTIAATAIVDGIDMYEEAGPALLTERTEAVRQYFATVAEHFVTHSERIIDEALNQLASEADAMGTFALRSFGAPVHDSRRDAARELKERLGDGLRVRLKISRGRPEGTARFINKHEFVAELLRVIFTNLDARDPSQPLPKRIPMEKVGLSIFGPTDVRGEMRRQLKRFDLEWADLILRAMQTYQFKAYPEILERFSIAFSLSQTSFFCITACFQSAMAKSE